MIASKRLFHYRWFYPFAAIAFGLLIIGFLLSNRVAMLFYEQLSWRSTDLILRTSAHVTTDPRVAIIAINDRSLSAEHGYGERLENWDRSIYAELIEKLEAAGARAVALDILFIGSAEGDAALAQAIQNASIPVILPVGQEGISGEFVKPTEPIYAATDWIGHVNVEFDHDLVVRRVDAMLDDGNEFVPPVGLVAAAAYWRLPPEMSMENSITSGELPNGASIPTDSEGNFLINFSQPQSYLTCEFSAFMQGDNALCIEGSLKDKLVFIGWGLSDGNDYYNTPAGAMNGVEIHANLTASLLNDMMPHEQPRWTQFVLILLAALLVGLFYSTKNTLLILITECMTAVSYIGICLMIFQSSGIRVDMAGPLLTMLLINGLLLAIQSIVNRKEKRMVLELFKNQTSPQVVNKLLNAAENGTLDLGGEERIVSIVFFDMRNFTKISEYLTPQEVVHIINTYLSIITDSLVEKGGTLTSYAGDQVMAIFNAPMAMQNHAEKAIMAAQYTMDKIEEFNQSEDAEVLPVKSHFGAGVESGNVIVGNIGSVNHFNYTAIGDSVNIAARLCGLAPPSTIYVGGLATDMVSPHCKQSLVLMGGRQIKGRRGKVQIYQSQHTIQPKLLAGPFHLPGASASAKLVHQLNGAEQQ